MGQPYERFGRDRHRPPGDWVQATPLLEVAGIVFRKRDAGAFFVAVARAEREGRRYGLELERQPDNPEDANAIAVYGVAAERRLLRGWRERRWHIGFVPRAVAAEIVASFTERGLPIAAELYSLFRQGDFLEVRFFVLGPPGHGVKARARRGD